MTRIHRTFLALAVCLPTLALAQPQSSAPALPDTPVGMALRQFVAALNSGSLQSLETFHTERGGEADFAQQDLGFYQQSGGIDLGKIMNASDFRIEIEAKTRKESRGIILVFAVDPAPPHPVADVGVRPPGAPGRGGPGGGPDGPDQGPRAAEEIIADAPAIVEAAMAGGFSGVVLIARDGKPVLERAGGLANRNFEVKNRMDTRFNLGSINKTFTKLAIAQLMEAGKISLDDKLSKFLPDYPNADALAKVTVEQLVEMKSGIGDFFGREFEATPKSRIRTLKDYLPLFAAKPLAFEPGTARAYSNGGYVVLGLIIEKASAENYFDYVREHIFKPAGMNATGSYEMDEIVPNLAVGYMRKAAGEYRDNVYTRPARGSSAGGGYSTAPDLLSYAEALVANRLTSAPYTSWYLGGPKPDPQAAKKTASGPPRGGLGIAGGSPGVNAVLEVNPAQRLVVVVLSNADEPAAEDLARTIRRGR